MNVPSTNDLSTSHAHTNGTSMSKKPASIDLSHHLNTLAKSRAPSPMKDLLHFMTNPGMVSLAGGLPHPSLFPFDKLNFDAYPNDTILNADTGLPTSAELDSWSIHRSPVEGEFSSLSNIMQYGSAYGLPSLSAFCHSLTASLFSPAYSDYEIFLNTGCTDGWAKVVGLLCEKDDNVLVEEYTYPSAQAVWRPLGCKAVPVKMDQEDGMRADNLELVLGNWEKERAGEKRPKLMYLVPVGQNPTGASMSLERRKAIYEVCVKYDVIIVEDDPYYFLQFSQYSANRTQKTAPLTTEEYKTSLVPSFLSVDYQGRVIRLDTFSKTLAPGSRVGYFVANPIFTERLVRATEVTTQAPSGFSQAILSELLNRWGVEGYLRWLTNLAGQYETRRNWMCDLLSTTFDLVTAADSGVKGAEGFVGFEKSTLENPNRTPIFSFFPPSSGMFVWLKFYVATCPAYQELKKDSTIKDPEEVFMKKVWSEMIAHSVLLTPGSYYTPWEGAKTKDTKEPGMGFFRLAFSTTTKEETVVAISRMATVFQKLWA